MKLNGLVKISVLAFALLFGTLAVAHADEADDFINEYTKAVEMFESLSDKATISQEDMTKFSESMVSLNQKAIELQSSGKQMSQEQMQKLNDLGMRMGAVAQKLSAKMQ